MIYRADPGNWFEKFNGLQAGDTLELQPGRYEHDNLSLTTAGATLRGGPEVVFVGPGRLTVKGDGVKLEGVRFEGDFLNGALRLGTGSNQVFGVRVEDCLFFKTKGTPLILANLKAGLVAGNRFEEINTGIEGKGVSAVLPIICDDVRIADNSFRWIAADCIQGGGVASAWYRNLIIEHNRVIAPPEDYELAGGENAFDFKGFDGPGPVVITKNLIEGYRPVYPDGIGHKGGSTGSAMVVHMGASNVRIVDNEIWDCTEGIVLADQSHQGHPPAKDNRIERNLFVRCQDFASNDYRPAQRGLALFLKRLDNTNRVEDNLIVACANDVWEYKSAAVVVDNEIFETMDDYREVYPEVPTPTPAPDNQAILDRIDDLQASIDELRTDFANVLNAVADALRKLYGSN